MKILHLIYTEAVAGAEKYLVNLLPGLQQYNIECHLICICPKSSVSILTSYCDIMRSKGIKTRLIAGRRKNFLSISKAINNYLKAESISIIHSHLSNADLIAVLIKIIYNKKIFIISGKHGYDERYLVKYSAKANTYIIDRNLYYYFTKFLLNKIDINLAASKAIADLYFNIQLTAKSFHYIHHGIYPIPTNSDNNNSKIQLIIVGRLEKVKGHKFLLEAMQQVLKQFPQINLLILGEGSEKNNLMKQAAEAGIDKHLFFMGFHPDPYQYMARSYMIIQPSLFESFGLVYIEAFALKIPVVAFDVPAANEIITDNETGLLAPVSDSKALAEKIIYLLKNPGVKYKLQECAYQKFLAHYTAERMISETVSWYKSVVHHTA